jgi:tetratricopeptide (TPR) repeat protein
MSAKPRKKKKQRGRLAAILVAALGCVAAALVIFQTKRPPTEIPRIASANISTNRLAAIESARARVLSKPRSADAWGEYGKVLRAFDFHAESLGCFRAAESLDPKNPRWPFFISRILRAEDPVESLRYLKRAVELTGNSPEAPRYYLAKILAEEGAIHEAETHAQALLDAHADFIPARMLLAQIAFAKGDTNAAESNVKMCLNDPRTGRSAWALLASLQQRRNDVVAAEESSRKAAAAAADQPIADAFEAEVLALRGDPQGISDRVHTLLAERNIPEAARLIDQLVREHPDFADTWLVRGRLLLLQKQYPAAEESLRRHLQMDPKSTQGYFQLGSVYIAAGQFAAAQNAFRRAIELKADFGPAWFNLAYALGREGKWAEARPAFEQAIRYNPEHIESYLLLADVHLQLGNRVEAEKQLQSAGRISPQDPRVAALQRKMVAPPQVAKERKE